MARDIADFDTNLVGRDLISDKFRPIGERLGSPELSGGTEFSSGGQLYRVEDTGKGTRRIVGVGSLQDKIQEDLKRAQQTAISTLEGGRPKIGEIYGSRRQSLQGEIDPTKRRYEQLLEEVTRREQDEMQRTNLAQSRELGRRGISSDSGIFDRTINEALNPISRFYTGQAKEVGFEQESALRAIQNAISELTNQEAQQNLGLDQNIAQMQFQGGGNLANVALQALAQQQAAAEAASQRTLQQALANLQAGFTEREMRINEERAPIELQLLQNQLAKAQQGGGAYNPFSTINGLNTFSLTPNEPKPSQSSARIIG